LGAVAGDGKLEKPVESAGGGNPDRAFTVLQQMSSVIAGEAIRLTEQVNPSAMLVYQAPTGSRDPVAAIPIPEPPSCVERRCLAQDRRRLRDSTDQSRDPRRHPAAERAIHVFAEGPVTRNGVALRRPRSPPPQPGLRPCPQSSVAVLEQFVDPE